jgi:hypothetical protein
MQVTLANWRTRALHRWAFHHVRGVSQLRKILA